MPGKLDVGEYDPSTDSITIEGTRYAGCLFRDGFGINAMIGQVLRIDKHEDGLVTVTRLRDLEVPNRALNPSLDKGAIP